MREQPDEEIHRVQEGPKFRSLCTQLHVESARGCVHQLRSSPNPVVQGFLWRFHHDQLLTQPPAPLPSPQRMGGGAESFKLLIVAWSFW